MKVTQLEYLGMGTMIQDTDSTLEHWPFVSTVLYLLFIISTEMPKSVLLELIVDCKSKESTSIITFAQPEIMLQLSPFWEELHFPMLGKMLGPKQKNLVGMGSLPNQNFFLILLDTYTFPNIWK